MNAILNLGETAMFSLTKALLIYEQHSGNKTAVSVHPVNQGVIGAGEPITMEAIEALSVSLGRNLSACYLSPEVVCLGLGRMAWFCPSNRRRIWFTKNTECAHLNGKVVQHPPLLFVVKDRQLSVFALAKNERPSATTKLYRAPYWNLYDDGAMCKGSARYPEQPIPANIKQFEDAFFNSAFSHPNVRSKLCKHPQGHKGLWEESAARPIQDWGKYFKQSLYPLKRTVEAVVTAK
jgi:PRTRC genetic system protein B